MNNDTSLNYELLKLLIKPGHVYFKCTDGEVYCAEMETPEPRKPFSMPRLVPEETEEETNATQ